MSKKKYDFSGYATKNNIKCTDGRTIKEDAFKHNDGLKVPIVWQHLHNDPDNILGHGILENRKDGVYVYGMFNETEKGKKAKMIVEHGDISALSIYANGLVQKGADVVHGFIKEVSLVIAGANSGAYIDNLVIEHGDGGVTAVAEEAIISADVKPDNSDLEHEDKDLEHSEAGETMQKVFDSLTDVQKEVVFAMLGTALTQKGSEGTSAEHSDNDTNDNNDSEGGSTMKKNIFEGSATGSGATTLTHSQLATIINDAKTFGSLKESLLAHAQDYGIENIDLLFPDAAQVGKMEWFKREDDWVAGIFAAVSRTPFSRIKSMFADMDIATARARGYIKATEKKEVYMKAAKRVTTPTTVYVKQKLDRDDIIDVTDFDVVAMIRFQLRTLLNEELAQAYLLGDGRAVDDPEKINEDNIRPIWTEDDLFCIKHKLATQTDYKAMVKEISLANEDYRGSGAATFYTTPGNHANMLWIEDTTGRRIYENDASLCAALNVSKIVEIPQMYGKVRTLEDNSKRALIGIKVNLKDYNVGADKGGEINSFDDFDIDFNQYKYLMETRCSAALTRAKSAQVFEYETVAAH